MNELSLLFLSGLISCTGPYKTVSIELPNPCYAVSRTERSGNILLVYLERVGEVCPQVITFKSLKVEKDIEKIRIMLDNRVWKELKLSEEKDEH